MKLKIAIVLEHQILLESLKTLIESDSSLNVIYSSNDAKISQKDFKGFRIIPDVVIIAFSNPNRDHIKIINFLKKRGVKCIAVTTRRLNTHSKIIVAGAEMCFSDYQSVKEFLYKIKSVSKKTDLPEKDQLSLNDFNNEVRNKEIINYTLSSLSNRELEIIRLCCYDYTSRELAEKLFISESTVNNHIKKIIQKIGCDSRVGIVRFAIKSNLYEL